MLGCYLHVERVRISVALRYYDHNTQISQVHKDVLADS